MKKEVKILILLFVLLLIVNYSFIDSYIEKTYRNFEVGVVERVIDGDTVIINGTSVRLLGMNSPEKGEDYFIESKNFLENETLGEVVSIHFEGQKFDKYNRKLAYLYLDGKNINLESVKNGYSNFYFPSGKNKYYKKFLAAWANCLLEGKNLCEFSNEKCISLENWDTKNQVVELKNNCDYEVNLDGWTIKDEGRKKYTFENKIIEAEEIIPITNEDFNESYVWTKSGDSIFIRDKENKLVYFDTY
jgi:micrococcal nuclease